MPFSGGVLADPVPLKVTFWGAPAASSDIESVPVTSPEPPGAKVTLIVQLPSDGTLPTQLSFSAKLAVVEILPMFSAAVP
jgi:hypothetical protein